MSNWKLHKVLLKVKNQTNESSETRGARCLEHSEDAQTNWGRVISLRVPYSSFDLDQAWLSIWTEEPFYPAPGDFNLRREQTTNGRATIISSVFARQVLS